MVILEFFFLRGLPALSVDIGNFSVVVLPIYLNGRSKSDWNLLSDIVEDNENKRILICDFSSRVDCQ